MIELRDALRALRGTPLVSTVAILSLALGIGANTAMFSILDALVLRALPVRHADRLVVLTDTDGSRLWTNPIWEAIRERRVADGAFAFSATRFNLASGGEVEPAEGLWASGGMFDVLGVDPFIGRTFTEADDRRGGGPDGPVAVISHRFWERRFAGDRNIVGRRFTLGGVPTTIIGVTPPSFLGPDVGRAFDVAVPLAAHPLITRNRTFLDSRSTWWLRVIVRLPSGQGAEQSASALRALQAGIADVTRPTDLRPQDAAHHLAKPFVLRSASSGTSDLRDRYRRPVFTLMAVVALTLLIACGNIANLMLARTTARRHELSVRTALGASAVQLARQLLAESLLLAGVGAALGILLAARGSRLIVSRLSTMNSAVFLDVGIDSRMLGFTAAVTVGTALLFGIVPALRAARVAPIEALKEQGRDTSSGRGVGVAGWLVMAQVALSLVLLTGAGLFVRTFASLVNRELGFDSDRALVVTIGAQRTGVDSAARGAMYERIRQAAMAVPGVSNAALGWVAPISGDNNVRLMEFPGRPDRPEGERRVFRNDISSGWFASFGIPVVAGRDFDARDRLGAARAVIVNEAFARKFFDRENPIGRTIAESPTPGADLAPMEIVGVVGDAVYRSAREGVPPTVYSPLAQRQRPPTTIHLTVRAAAGDPASLARRTAAAVIGVNRDLDLTFRPLAEMVDASLARERLVATLSGFFGVLALVLAALGLYGTTSYAVNQRRIDLGIRMALGVSPAGIVRLVLARVALMVGGGVALGGVVSWWASKLIATLLFDLTPGDVPTTVAAVIVLAGIAAVAGGIPALRAARIDPARVLREG